MSSSMSSFSLHRRQTLLSEVDGIWQDLEEVEDTEVAEPITISECQMVRMALGDDDAMMAALPSACKIMAPSTHQATAMASPLVTRLLSYDNSAHIAGKVTLSECKKLCATLSASGADGVSMVVPKACTSMINKTHDVKPGTGLTPAAPRPLQRSPTYIAMHDYPPTAC